VHQSSLLYTGPLLCGYDVPIKGLRQCTESGPDCGVHFDDLLQNLLHVELFSYEILFLSAIVTSYYRQVSAKRSHAGIVLLSGPKMGFHTQGDTLPR